MPRNPPSTVKEERSPPRQPHLTLASAVPGTFAEAPPSQPIQSVYPVPGEVNILPQPTYSQTILQTPTIATDSSSLPPQPYTAGPSSATSRRQSASSMRHASMTFESVQPSQTPTGRISKAKKGKRVHACEFPGCGKVCRCLYKTNSVLKVSRSSREQSTDGVMSLTTTQKHSGVSSQVVINLSID